MTRGPLFALAALAGFALSLASFLRGRCRGVHDLIRTPLGGFRCSRCGRIFADFGESGSMDDGYLDKRTQFGREPGEGVTREWFVQ